MSQIVQTDAGILAKNAGKIEPSYSLLKQLLDCYERGDFGDAELHAKRIARQFPKHQFAWKILGAVFSQTGRKNDAVEANQMAVSLAPHDTEALFNLGNALKDIGKLEEAITNYERAISLRPDFSEAHNNLGATWKEIGELELALKSYKKAISLNQDFAAAHNNLGVVLKELGRWDAAEKSYIRAIELKPDYAEAHNNLGVVLKELGRWDAAEKSYIRAIELKSSYAEAFTNLGIILHQKRKFDLALDCHRKAITLQPDFAEAFCNLGNTLIEMKMPEEAEASYTKALGYKPDLVEARENRGLLFFARKDFVAALRDFESCFSLGSSAYVLSTLYAMGNFEAIHERFSTRLELDKDNLEVAAFSSFFSQTQQTVAAHTFCDKPLDFLHFSNISQHQLDSELFVSGLIQELNEIDSVWEPPGKTTRNGRRSEPNVNILSLESDRVKQLKRIIELELDSYYKKFQNESCDLVKNWPMRKNLFGWYVVLGEQGYQDLHIHPGGWVSGVIYLKVVPPLLKKEGAIEFTLSGKHYDHPNSQTRTHQPSVGDIVLFPSSLHHRTIPFSSNKDRIVISFDLRPNE